VAGARLLLDVSRLERAGATREEQRAVRASARRSIRAALANAPRTAFTRAELLRLAGRAEWRLGRRRRALALLARSAESADALHAPAARARTLATAAGLLRESPALRLCGLDASGCAAEAGRIADALGFAASAERFLRA
jgi:hypothetical protein